MLRALFAIALCSSLAALAATTNWRETDGTAQSSGKAIDPVIQWNRNLLSIVRTPGAQPSTVHATHSFAIMHAAIYDAVNAIDGTHEPYLVHLKGVPPDTSQEAATDSAAHEILVALYPTLKQKLDAAFQLSLVQIPDGDDKAMGILVGQTVADQLLALRSNDGANAPAYSLYFWNCSRRLPIHTSELPPSNLSSRIGRTSLPLPWTVQANFAPVLPPH